MPANPGVTNRADRLCRRSGANPPVAHHVAAKPCCQPGTCRLSGPSRDAGCWRAQFGQSAQGDAGSRLPDNQRLRTERGDGLRHHVALDWRARSCAWQRTGWRRSAGAGFHGSALPPWRGRRNRHWRCGPGMGLSGGPDTHRARLRAPPFPEHARRPFVSNRRPWSKRRIQPTGVSGPQRPAGETTGPTHRTRRGRGVLGHAGRSNGCSGRATWPGRIGPAGRLVAATQWLRIEPGVVRRGRVNPLARGHGAPGLGHSRVLAFKRSRQGRCGPPGGNCTTRGRAGGYGDRQGRRHGPTEGRHGHLA